MKTKYQKRLERKVSKLLKRLKIEVDPLILKKYPPEDILKANRK